MLTLSPFAPTQIFEQIQPTPSVNRVAGRPFTLPSHEEGAGRQPRPETPKGNPSDQPLSGFGPSASLLSSALLSELGRQSQQQAVQQAQKPISEDEADPEKASGKKKRTSPDAKDAAAKDTAEGADAPFAVVSASATQPTGGTQPTTGGPAAALPPQDGTTVRTATESGAANDSTPLYNDADRSGFLVRLQRARAVYEQGQIASGSYSFAQSAELFQMVA